MMLPPARLDGEQTLECDVCVVGSGAAGMTVACELDGSGLQVLLLEAGRDAYDAKEQDALRGEVEDGSPHSPPDMYRRRMLGGATTIWGGRCVPLSPIDLEIREHVPNSGWPISWAELERHYPKAQHYCEAGAYAYTVAGALGAAAPPTVEGFADPDLDITEIERFSPPTNFGRKYLQQLTASANVSVMLQAKAVRLHQSGGVITALAGEGAAGQAFTVRARHFVLAMGGLETPRLLMNSDATNRGGIGNEGGALGRFYMCHMENTLGVLRMTPANRPIALHFERTADHTYVRRKFAVSAAAQARDGLLNTVARMNHPLIGDPAHRSGVLSAMYLVKDAIIPEYRRKLAVIELANRDRMRRDIRFWASHAANVGLDSVGVARFGLDWMRRRTFARRKLPFVVLKRRDGSYPLDVNAEQIPDPSNRVTLAGEQGAPDRQIRVNWRLMDQDVDSLLRSMVVMRDAFARSGCAVLEFDEAALAEQIRASAPVGGHHIGTARMADSPAQGVVDRHCRVHGVANLHLAGAAVFPTCGHANPTLTIVALAVRLAERLKHVTQEIVREYGVAAAR